MTLPEKRDKDSAADSLAAQKALVYLPPPTPRHTKLDGHRTSTLWQSLTLRLER